MVPALVIAVESNDSGRHIEYSSWKEDDLDEIM